MNKRFASLADIVSGRSLAVGLIGLGSSLPLLAQTTDPFDTALATATAKVTSYAGALVGLAAVSVVFLIAIKYVKKLPRAS